MIQFRGGWLPDTPDQRDHVFAAPWLGDLPPQGDLGSCTANAIAGAVEFDQMKQGLAEATPSRLFIYYGERVIEGTVAQDSGAMIRDGMKVMVKSGAPPEPLWPYDVARFAEQPPQAAYVEALNHQVLAYARVNQDARSLKAMLASGFPVVFGFTVYESMMTPAVQASGNVPMPGWVFDAVLGGHAVLLVGYDDSTQLFRFRNSWGTGWGQAGYGTLPYAYVTNDNLADDFWTVRLIE
jgi:C1A family cysteine protease